MGLNTQKFNTWIRQHKLFALASPIVILLLIYFVTTSLNGMKVSFNDGQIENGYNNSLPNQSNELEIKDPNSYFKESIKDSLERSRSKGSIKNIMGREEEKDSLERILEDLDSFSIDDNTISSNLYDNNKLSAENSKPTSTYSSKPKQLSESEKRLEYRKMLQQAKEERKARSQDYSAPIKNNAGLNELISKVNIRATIYRDQFIIPGNRVTLILREDFHFNEKMFPKNTFVYATANIKQSRVLLDIKNIDGFQIPLEVRDEEDDRLGIHNEKAGELLMEFYSEVQEGSVQDISKELSDNVDIPMTNNAIRAFGKFFGQKKKKNRDEILLMNGHKVYLVSK